MAKKSAEARQRHREAKVKRHFEKRADLRKKIKDPNVSEEEKEQLRITLNKMPRDTSYIRLRNRCQLTGRPRGYLRKFGLSRICFREMASFGLIPGVVKASW